MYILAHSLEEADERVEAIRAGAVLDPGHRGWGSFEMANMLRDLHYSTNVKRARTVTSGSERGTG